MATPTHPAQITNTRMGESDPWAAADRATVHDTADGSVWELRQAAGAYVIVRRTRAGILYRSRVYNAERVVCRDLLAIILGCAR